MAITSGWIAGYRYTGASTSPASLTIFTISSFSSPSSWAVSGLISTHVFHITVVVGSANSCNQGIFAPDSPNVGETNGRKKNSPSPANSASVALTVAALLVGAVSASVVFHQPPCCWKYAEKVLISGAENEPSAWPIRFVNLL